MLCVYLFILAVVFTIGELAHKKAWYYPKTVEVFLSYLLFFNMGVMGILAAFSDCFTACGTEKYGSNNP